MWRNFRIRPGLLSLFWLLAFLVLPTARLMGQATGTVTGTVTDATGAVVPGAAVALVDRATNTSRETRSRSEGSFAFAAIQPGTSYVIKVTASGFRGWESQPFAVRPGDELSYNAKLEVMSADASITVEAVEDSLAAHLDTGERSDIITSKDLDTLSITGRDATELIRTLPGMALSSGNQGLFNRPGYNSAVVGLSGPTGAFSANGAGPTGMAVLIDGVSLTDIASNSGSVQQVNSEMIAEVKADTSSFSAVSAKGPAVMSATSKTGGLNFHGEGYLYTRHTELNANDWYDNYLSQSRPSGSYFFPGAQLSGPLPLPLTSYNHNKDKLFFFAGFEYYNQSFEANQQAMATWVPTMGERKGDFSANTLNAELCGARPDGLVNPNAIQPMCYTNNWLPTGANLPNQNAAPYADPNGVALVNWLPLPNADPFTNKFGYNYIKSVNQTQNGFQLHATLQSILTPKDTLFFVYGLQREVDYDPVGLGYSPTLSIPYPGNVSTGDISSILTAHWTRLISANLTNEFSAALSLVSLPGKLGNANGVYRYNMNNYNQGNGNFNLLGMYKNTGDLAVPALQDYGNLGYPQMLMPGGFWANRVHTKKTDPIFQDDVSWQVKNHFFKFGFYYEQGVYNGIADSSNAYPQGMYTFNPGNDFYEYSTAPFKSAQYISCTTDDPNATLRASGAGYIGSCFNPIALMYMGYADSYTQTNFTPTVDMRYTTVAGFINDHVRIRRVTFDAGFRLEHLGPWTDKHNNGLATFSSDLFSQQCGGFSGTIGLDRNLCGNGVEPGLTWHGINSAVSNSVNTPTQVYITPRAGGAIDLRGNGKTIVRGGGGLYRNQEQFNPYALAAATAQGYQTTYLTGQLTFNGIDSQTPVVPPDFSAYTLSASDTKRPMYYQYNLAIDQMAPWRSIVEVAYVGSHNVNLGSYNNSSYNSASDLNIICGIEKGCPTNNNPLNPTDNLIDIDLSTVPTAYLVDYGNVDSIAGLSTPDQDIYRRYPFYQHVYQLKHNFYSNYNSLQVKWEKNAGFINYRANYTFAKNLATAASYNNNIVDPVNLRNDYNPVPYDRTHVVNVTVFFDPSAKWSYKGGSKWLAAIVNRWQISDISSIQSGFPLASVNGNNFGFGYGQIQAVQVGSLQQAGKSMIDTCVNTYGIQSGWCVTQMNPIVWLGTSDVQMMPGLVCNPAGGSGTHRYINPLCFSIPQPNTNGVYRLPYMHSPYSQDHDVTLFKNFSMHEGKLLQIRMAAFNVLNHPLVSFNQLNTNNMQLAFQGGTVGQPLTQDMLKYQDFGVADIKVGSRLVELGAKFSF